MNKIESFFDHRSSTVSYIVFDPESLDAVIIDPVLDYDPVGSKIWTESSEKLLKFVRSHSLTVRYILETHAHADHLSGSQSLKKALPDTKIAVSECITIVQKTFKTIFDLPANFPIDGSQFDRLLVSGETVSAGTLTFDIIATPGHTPACLSFLFDDVVFTGDALFMPDMGTGRCDFPAGDAETLYDSITQGLYMLSDSTRVFVGHDYQPGGRELAFETTIGEQKRKNIQLSATTTKQEFVKFRSDRDKTLSAPKLLFQSVQVNIDAGHLPESNQDCKRYLKIPVNVFRPDEEGELELSEC